MVNEGLNEETCTECGGKLTHDDIAMTRKLINRGAKQFMCLSCLAAFYKVPVSRLEEKMEEFKKSGCTLFYI